MAASRPTRPLLQEARVIDVSNENVPGYFLLLEMAFYAKRCVALIQQALVDGTVRRMANGATLAHCLMLVDKRAALLRVTFEASFVSAEERKSAGFQPLLHVRRSALNGDPFVRFMAIAAAHLAFEHRMVMRQRERCANFQVTLETSIRRLSRIDDRACSAASFNVQTPRPMTRFTPHVLGVFPFCLEPRVSGCAEIAHDLFVACRAFL